MTFRFDSRSLLGQFSDNCRVLIDPLLDVEEEHGPVPKCHSLTAFLYEGGRSSGDLIIPGKKILFSIVTK